MGIITLIFFYRNIYRNKIISAISECLQDRKKYRNDFISEFISSIQKFVYRNKFLDWEGLKKQGFTGGFSPQKQDTFLHLNLEMNFYFCTYFSKWISISVLIPRNECLFLYHFLRVMIQSKKKRNKCRIDCEII